MCEGKKDLPDSVKFPYWDNIASLEPSDDLILYCLIKYKYRLKEMATETERS